MAKRGLSIAQLKKELADREKAFTALEKQHAKLSKEIQAVEAKMKAIAGGGSGSGRVGRPPSAGKASTAGASGRRGRGKNSMTLPDAIAAAMEIGAVVSPKEAGALVRANGYQTKSKTFGVQVATALAKDARFKKMGRAQYKRIK